MEPETMSIVINANGNVPDLLALLEALYEFLDEYSGKAEGVIESFRFKEGEGQ